MTSIKQINANRQNARHSTGPVTHEGKLQSRRNAVRHGLTAETVIAVLEDADDYIAFEGAVTADYDPQSATERELVLRLASLLWRLRRATTIESGLFDVQLRQMMKHRSRTRFRHSLQPFRAAAAPNLDRPTRDELVVSIVLGDYVLKYD